nr:RagB/SusD family protein [uncultured Pedobacter sp.]
MKSELKYYSKYIIIAVVCVSLFSCKKTFDKDPGNALSQEQAYRNVYDADAAVLGIYGKFLGLAKQYTVLNEVRADLTTVTANADINLRQLNTHTETASNTYASPLPFYQVIMNCNDALYNFTKMRNENRLTVDEYQQRYSDVGAIRCWLYLQLGIHWGAVPYVTDPIANIDDLKDKTKFERIPFDQLLDKLVAFGESLPYKDQYPAGSSLETTYDGYNMDKIYIFKRTILGDINLWKGNWAKAAEYYNKVMNAASILYPAMNSDQYYETYKIGYASQIQNGGWGTIFSQPINERYSNYENIWVMPFDKNFDPVNPFINLFSAGGAYLLKPSQKAISNWYNEESNTNTRVGDTYRANGSINFNTPGNEEIIKYTGGYNKNSPFETTGKWILYRASILHLRMAEAANRDNRSQLAYALLNGGIYGTFDDPTTSSKDDNRNVTNVEQSETDITSPYYLDGRQGNNPVYRAPYYRNRGIRNRVSLAKIVIDSTKYFDMNTLPTVTKDANGVITSYKNRPITDQAGLSLFMEDNIVKEEAEECAFEGYRWGDLLRVALRRTDDPTYLARKVAAKFPLGSADYTTVYNKLLDKANWYLPFTW